MPSVMSCIAVWSPSLRGSMSTKSHSTPPTAHSASPGRHSSTVYGFGPGLFPFVRQHEPGLFADLGDAVRVGCGQEDGDAGTG